MFVGEGLFHPVTSKKKKNNPKGFIIQVVSWSAGLYYIAETNFKFLSSYITLFAS